MLFIPYKTTTGGTGMSTQFFEIKEYVSPQLPFFSAKNREEPPLLLHCRWDTGLDGVGFGDFHGYHTSSIIYLKELPRVIS